MAQVAIAYNRGSYDPAKGLKQGHKNGDGKYYGECFAEFLKLAKQVQPAPAPAAPKPAAATIKVDTSGATLNLRARPDGSAPILAALPNGHPLTGTGESDDGWVKVKARLGGQDLTGWVAERYTKAATSPGR